MRRAVVKTGINGAAYAGALTLFGVMSASVCWNKGWDYAESKKPTKFY